MLGHKTLQGHRNIINLLAVSFDPEYIYVTGPNLDLKYGPLVEVFRLVLVFPWAMSDLGGYCSEGRSIPPDVAAGIVSDIADGLEALHIHDIIHSDLKPGNNLLFRDADTGLIDKIADFGFIASRQNDRISEGNSWRWAHPEYAIDTPDNSAEYIESYESSIGDVFLLGLIAIFVALEGYWDDDPSQPTEQRRSNLARMLSKKYQEFWPDDQLMLGKWNQLLDKTIVQNPNQQMDPKDLDSVRRELTDR